MRSMLAVVALHFMRGERVPILAAMSTEISFWLGHLRQERLRGT